MCENATCHVTNRLLARLGSNADPEDIAALFCRKVDWAAPGAPDALPWTGRRVGRRHVVDFVRQSRTLMEQNHLTVEDIFIHDERAVIIGQRHYRWRGTGQTVESEFAMILTITGGLITRFRLLEDSHAIAQAAR